MILLLTSLAKIISGFGNARILQLPDPLLGMTYRYVLMGVGAIELVIAAVCFSPMRVGLKAGLVSWLATGFVFYRFGAWWVGYNKPCKCMGNLTDALHISPEITEAAMKIILAYLLIGSYAILFWSWRQKGQTSGTAILPEKPASIA